ncbi:hypothetical protein ACFL6I_17010 [candidate division KSB1 bacterium]
MKKCPRCGSKNVDDHEYMGAVCIVCKDCGYDEAAELDMYHGHRTSQKAKARHSPYKTGGSSRSKKTQN